MSQPSYKSEFGVAFQAHILAVMLKIPGFVIRYRTALDHQYFVDADHRTVAKLLLAQVDEYQQLPTKPTFIEEVHQFVSDKDFSRVKKCVEGLYEDEVLDAAAVASKVVDFGRNQALVNAVLKSAEKLDQGNHAIRPLIDEALLVGEDLLNVGTDYHESVEERSTWYTNPEVQESIRTGIAHMDLALGGGSTRGELNVILAPPGRGKSTSLINVGYGAVTDVGGLDVAYYTLEMNRRKVLMRYDDRLMGPRVKYKRSKPKQYVQEMGQRVSKMVFGRLFVQDYPTRTAGISNIRSHLALLRSRGFFPDVIVVDYGDIMKAERRLGEMRHEQAGIYEDLRQLAGEFDASVWTASQTSRSALNKETVTIEDFAEAFEKAAIADVVWALCQSDDEKIEQRCRFFAAKLRNAEDGRTVECEIKRDQCLIRSVALVDAAGNLISGQSLSGTASQQAKIDKVKVASGLKKKRGGKSAPKKEVNL